MAGHLFVKILKTAGIIMGVIILAVVILVILSLIGIAELIIQFTDKKKIQRYIY